MPKHGPLYVTGEIFKVLTAGSSLWILPLANRLPQLSAASWVCPVFRLPPGTVRPGAITKITYGSQSTSHEKVTQLQLV